MTNSATKSTRKQPAAKRTTRPAPAEAAAAPTQHDGGSTDFQTIAIPAETIEVASEQLETASEFVRKAAESGLEQSRALLDGLRDAADKATLSFDDTASASKEAASELNICAVNAFKSSTELSLEYVRALAGARSWGDVVEICGEHGRKQFEQLTKSNTELTDAFSHYAKQAAKPFSLAVPYSK